ncbi:MAG: ATP-binding protein [Trueperaceae bacterium]|nr:ATP-binding protein [Trueperaceae bacterium]
METPRTTDALREAALRFLRRFGLVAAAWATLLGLTVPGGVQRTGVLAVGLAILWAWALASQVVRDPYMWWGGWFVVAIGLELLGPLARTGGSSLAGGVSFLVLAGVALSLRRAWVAATVAVLAVVALLRPLVNDAWTIGGSISTVLLFVFGGLAVTWLMEVVARAQAERDRLTAALNEAEREAAVARERSEAAARLHDSVLQTLTAIGRTEDPTASARLARRAGQELRDFLRRASHGEGHDDLGDALRAAVTAAADGGAVGVSIVGDHHLDDAGTALVDAAAEAVRNAVRHGQPPVRVLLERADDELVCWVSDRGEGFDPTAVDPDRLGVRRSIVARLETIGGSARLTTEHGCEWRLAVPANT